ncbi:MAG: hypothetical protein CVT49_06860 [candidate division Zixibacteria bacterium HGW-Zixibacteria-1]|nr:MAG: hypothetical protein CVT49_06860 [candidate division Zixibacteria bacterium HGW-Zixibacteria-1]
MTPLERLADVAPVFVIFPVMYMMLRVILDHYTRKRLIEKGLVGEEVKKFFQDGADRFLPSSLKWGIVLTFLGIAMVLMRLASDYIPAETAIGIMLVAAGLGLLVYYFSWPRRELKKSKQKCMTKE